MGSCSLDAVAGEEAAWACPPIRYERLVYSIPLNLGLNPQDAEDVTQTTFAQLLASLDRIQEPDRVGAWLSTVSKRQSIRLIEQRVRERDRIVAAAAVSEIDHGGIESLVEDIESGSTKA